MLPSSVLSWLLLACAARQLPAPEPPEAAGMLGTVETLAEQRFNRGRQRALEARLVGMGLPVQTERIDLYTPQDNLLIELPGDSDELIYVMAHWDKVDINLLTVLSRLLNGAIDPLISWTWGTQGAVDNATGVAVVAELAQRLQALPERHFTYRFLFVGAEEAGLRGTRAHVARMSKAEKARVALALNIDAAGLAYTDNCVMTRTSSADWVEAAKRSAESQGIPLGAASMPLGGTSDHVIFRRNSFGMDLGRGLLFNLTGGLLPQRSWFTSRSQMPTLFLSACEVLDAGDLLGSLIAVPTGRLHGPRDHMGQVSSERLFEVMAVAEGVLMAAEAAAKPEAP